MKEGRKAAEVEAHWLNEEREAMEAKHKKVEHENERLKHETLSGVLRSKRGAKG